MKVIVIGTGQLGLATASRFSHEHRVICVDLDARRVSELAAAHDSMHFTTNLRDNVADADVVFIAYDEPMESEPLVALVDDIVTDLTDDIALVIRTSIDFDDYQMVRDAIVRRTHHDVDVVVNPRVDDCDQIILVGTCEAGGYRIVEALYSGCEIYSTDVITAVIADVGVRYLRLERERLLKHVVVLCEQQKGDTQSLLNIIERTKK